MGSFFYCYIQFYRQRTSFLKYTKPLEGGCLRKYKHRKILNLTFEIYLEEVKECNRIKC